MKQAFAPKPFILGVLTSTMGAEEAVDALRDAGFDHDEVSVAFLVSAELGDEPLIDTSDPLAVELFEESLEREPFPMLENLGALAIRGVGMLAAGGPLLCALTDVALDAPRFRAARISDVLARAGFSQPEANLCIARLCLGDVVLAVPGVPAARGRLAQNVFHAHHARNIRPSGEWVRQNAPISRTDAPRLSSVA